MFGRCGRSRALPLVGIYATLLVGCSTYVLLDTFVIERSYAKVAPVATTTSQDQAQDDAATGAPGTDASEDSGGASSESGATGSQHRGTGGPGSGGGGRPGRHSPQDGGSSGGSQGGAGSSGSAAETTSATSSQPTATSTKSSSGTSTKLSEMTYLDTTVYVVDVYADDATQLLTALADDTYGKNVTDTTSSIAEAHGASVAINGDYYGVRNAGYVVRNGQLLRDTAASADQEDLVIYKDGSFEVVREGDVSARELVDAGAWQVFSFGPGLVEGGTVSVGEGDEVGRAMASNPRTAIGKVADGHYVLVVSDGRTAESAGLSLAELATFMADELGVTCAYNLDGGGSSTLYYNGAVVNNPTTGGNTIKERGVSDIVYLAS